MTLYPVTPAISLLSGDSQVTVAMPLSEVATTLRGAEGAISAEPRFSNRFGVPFPAPVIFPMTCELPSSVLTVVADAARSRLQMSAAAPATWGLAIDVPEIVREVV